MRRRAIYKDKKRWGGERSCAASRSPEQRRLGSPRGCAAPAPTPPGPWAPGRRPTPAKDWAAPLRCCPLAHCSLGTRSHAAGAGGGGTIPAGVSPRTAGPFSHPTLSKLLGLGETLRLCSSAATRLSYAGLALPHRQCPGGSLSRLPMNGPFAAGKEPREFLLLPKTSSHPSKGNLFSPRFPPILCSHRGTHTHLHSGRPTRQHPAAGAWRAKPRPEVRLCCSGSDDFRAVFWQANPISVCSVRF